MNPSGTPVDGPPTDFCQLTMDRLLWLVGLSGPEEISVATVVVGSVDPVLVNVVA